jgi:hypothetical protein
VQLFENGSSRSNGVTARSVRAKLRKKYRKEKPPERGWQKSAAAGIRSGCGPPPIELFAIFVCPEVNNHLGRQIMVFPAGSRELPIELASFALRHRFRFGACVLIDKKNVP